MYCWSRVTIKEVNITILHFSGPHYLSQQTISKIFVAQFRTCKNILQYITKKRFLFGWIFRCTVGLGWQSTLLIFFDDDSNVFCLTSTILPKVMRTSYTSPRSQDFFTDTLQVNHNLPINISVFLTPFIVFLPFWKECSPEVRIFSWLKQLTLIILIVPLIQTKMLY